MAMQSATTDVKSTAGLKATEDDFDIVPEGVARVALSTGSSGSVVMTPVAGDDNSDTKYFQCSKCGVNHEWMVTTFIWFTPDTLSD